jgi:integrase
MNLVTLDNVSSDLAAHLASHAEAARGAYANNTERAIRSDILIFSAWCADNDRQHLPAFPETVADFVNAMAQAKAPASVRRYVSSIATFHRAARLESPCAAAIVKLALKRMHREKGRSQAQAGPLGRQLVEMMLDAAGCSVIDLRNKALLAVAYDTLCRRSELVALQIADLDLQADGSGSVIIPKSKTDQEGAGMVRYLAADTVRHLSAWLARSGAETGPLFRSVGKGGRVGQSLEASAIARTFKAMARGAGMAADKAGKISGHSSRVGAAQDMVQFGIELPAIMQAGGWKTPEMVSRYTARLDVRRGGAAKLAVLQNRA